MPLVLPPFEDRLSKAVAHYWRTLDAQKGKQKAGTDHGNRSAVTGGKQMDGFCSLVEWLLLQNGLGEASIYVRSRREIPGYFRPTKDWDMIVVHEGHLVAAVEFTSVRVAPHDKDVNVRMEETIILAANAWRAFREGICGMASPRPWLGWVMLFEDRTFQLRSALPSRTHPDTVRELWVESCGRRHEHVLRKFAQERLFDSAALIASMGKAGAQGAFVEPAADLTLKRSLASLMGHIGGHLALTGSRSGRFKETATVLRRKGCAREDGSHLARV